jgi:glycosyltransferase 2 family protein
VTTSGDVKSGFWGRHGLKLLVSALIGAAFYGVLYAGGLPLVPSHDALSDVSWLAILGYVACWCGVHLLRAGRWYFLLAPLGPVRPRHVLTVASVGFAAVLLFPLRTGEVVRPLMITRRTRLSAWAATGSVAAERVIDGLVLSVILFLALQLTRPLEPPPDHIGGLPLPARLVPELAYTALAMFAAVFLVMAAFFWRRSWVQRAIELCFGLISKRFAGWVSARIADVASGLEFLPKPAYMAPFSIMTLAYWGLNAFGSWLLASGVGLAQVGYGEACVLMGVLALGILAPSAPGFFGSFQIAVYAGLALFLPPEQVVGAGSAYVFFLYAVQLGVTVVAAAVSLVVEHQAGGQREILPASGAS